MKKPVALLLAILMLLAALPGMAEEAYALDIPALGMTLTRPEGYADAV